jgi:hypothetical protein
MNEILRFLKANEVLIYVLLGLLGLYHLRKFVLALREWQATVFGLERNNAQRRLNASASILTLAILIAAGEFILISFVLPRVPNFQVLQTPTLLVLTTVTPTLALSKPGSQTTPLFPTATQVNSATQVGNGCKPGKLEFTVPKNGQVVSGVLELKGILIVENFGFYKYEYSKSGSNVWITIAAGNTINPDQSLGFWDTSQLLPGDYQLSLVVSDNKSQFLPACITTVKVVSPSPIP